MKSNQLTYIESEDKLNLNIHVEETPTSIFTFFVIIGGLIGISPFAALIISILNKNHPGFGFIFSFIIAALVVFYLFRMAFWNKYGVERYTITKESVNLTADYKFYKDNVSTLTGNGIKVELIDIKQNTENKLTTAKLSFWLNEKQTVSTIDLPIDTLKEVITDIEKYLRSSKLCQTHSQD